MTNQWEVHYYKARITKSQFTDDMILELYNIITPDCDDMLANDFHEFIVSLDYTLNCDNRTLQSFQITHIESCSMICFDPNFVDRKGNTFSTTMLWISSKNPELNIMASEMTVDTHYKVLDYFKGLPRKLKIHKLVTQLA